jgi:hypothetical protein
MVRRIFTIIFSTILALTSVTLALGQHQQISTSTIELCANSGQILVSLDIQGNPKPITHNCPDCVAAIAAQDIPKEFSLVLPASFPSMAHPLEPIVAGPVHTQIPNHARGPPAVI